MKVYAVCLTISLVIAGTATGLLVLYDWVMLNALLVYAIKGNPTGDEFAIIAPLALGEVILVGFVVCVLIPATRDLYRKILGERIAQRQRNRTCPCPVHIPSKLRERLIPSSKDCGNPGAWGKDPYPNYGGYMWSQKDKG